MIPKKIHYCWYGHGNYSRQIQTCLSSWKKIMPDYELKLWNESNLPESPYAHNAYNHKIWSKVSNYVRLYALLNEGGIYLDVDVEVFKRFDDLLDGKFFLGIEYPYRVATGVMGAEVGNEILRKAIIDLTTSYDGSEKTASSGLSMSKVLQNEGFDLAITKLQQKGGATIYPSDYFYPWKFDEKYYPSCITDRTHSIHYWTGSWISPKDKMQIKLNRFLSSKTMLWARKVFRKFIKKKNNTETLSIKNL